MESNQTWSRRRRDHGRWLRTEQSITKTPLRDGTDLLRQWRQILTKIEGEAAQHQLREIEMLVGTTILALEDALAAQKTKQN